MKFRNVRFKLMPMNLQFFAEDGSSGGGSGAGGSVEDTSVEGTETKENTPTVEELLAQLAQERANSAKYKNLSDKYSKEAADSKKQLREKMSAEDQEAAAKKEADEAKDNRIKELEERMAIIDNTSFWGGKSIGMDEALAKSTAEAEAKGDKDAFRKNIASHIEAIKKAAYNQALKDRPDIKAGSGEPGKDSLAEELARKVAKKNVSVDTNSLKNFMVGGF